MHRNYTYFGKINQKNNNVQAGRIEQNIQKKISRRPFLTSQRTDIKDVNIEGTSLSKRRAIKFPKSQESQTYQKMKPHYLIQLKVDSLN